MLVSSRVRVCRGARRLRLWSRRSGLSSRRTVLLAPDAFADALAVREQLLRAPPLAVSVERVVDEDGEGEHAGDGHEAHDDQHDPRAHVLVEEVELPRNCPAAGHFADGHQAAREEQHQVLRAHV